MGFAAQVCGVFALLLSGVHTWMYWGLYCYPWLRSSFIAAYYIAAAGCVVAGLRACTQMQRAAPMLALLGVRVGSLVARTILNSGSQDAVWHYAVTEVRSRRTSHWGHLLTHVQGPSPLTPVPYTSNRVEAGLPG